MWTRRRKAALSLAVAALVVLVGGRMVAEFVAELYWFRSLGLERSFWTRWSAAWSVRLAVALPVGLIVYGNLWVIARSLGTIRVRRRYANIEIAERLPHGYVVGALLLISLFSAWWLSAGIGDPLAAAVSVRPPAWGLADPVFGKDLSFYIFRLPILDRLQTMAGVLVVWVGMLAVAAYVATGALRVVDGRLTIPPGPGRHLGLHVSAFLLVLALDVWLDRYHLVIQGNGMGGALLGYTDYHARLPGKVAVVVAAVVAAAAVAVGQWRGTRREGVVGLGLLLLTMLGANAVYPALLQKLVVEPNEFNRERPFIENHLAFTRRALGLDSLTVAALPYQEGAVLRPERLTAAMAGVPLWDERPLQETFRQEQNRFPHYEIGSVQADRYGPAGAAEQVAVAVREVNVEGLSANAQTWQNLHTNAVYVSGNGAVASPMARMQEDGTPAYYLSDLNPPRLAPQAPEELKLAEPAVFFGERTTGYVVVGTPGGPRGITLDAAWKRVLFAWAFQSRNLLLSGVVTPRSRLVFRRQVVERARAVAPFVHFPAEGSAYPVVRGGRIVWVVEGYTASSSFPLAPRVSLAAEEPLPVRYLRNSVKATVDGVTGEVRLYAADARDPILRAYSRLLPGLLRPLSEMPAELQRHLRVPVPLLDLQAQALGEYHLRDARAFYAKEDVWAVASETYRSESEPMRPSYVTMRLPGSSTPEFLLTVPFASRGRQNLTALLVARNDPPHYGERILYELPRDVQVPGPQQVESRIEQDPEISQQLSLWRQGGSTVSRGHLIVLPIDSTLVYVEPLFLEAVNAAIPQLARVILTSGPRSVMAPSLPGAVTALLGPDGAGAAPSPLPRPAGTPPAPGAPRDALAEARRLFDRAEQQLRSGDWAGFGRSWAELRALLRPPAAPAPRQP